MTRAPSVIVVGGGAIGLACAWALARRGAEVTVLERFDLVHDRGSHSGHTRVIRQAYYEGSSYVPLIQQADAQWVALEQRAGRALLERCGVLLFGPPDDPELRAAIETCEQCGLPSSVYDGAQARARWPVSMPDRWVACFDPSGGYLRVRPGMEAMAQEARAAGATLRYPVTVESLRLEDPLAVQLADGERVRADRIVVAAGAWLPQLCPTLLPGRLRRLRRILAWTTPAPEHHKALAAMPVWGAFLPDGFYYGFPYGNEGTPGLKLAVHTSSKQPALARPVDPDTVDRTAHPSDLEPLRRVLAEHLPLGQGPITSTHACLYTATDSWDFLVDRLPDDPRVVVAGGMSGHGFKFAPAIGMHVAALLLDDAVPRPDLSVAAHTA